MSQKQTFDESLAIFDSSTEYTPDEADGPKDEGGSDERGTPTELIDMLHGALDTELFALDPASGAQQTRIAETEFTKEDDGLSQSWCVDGDSLFLNPPYSDVEPWLKRVIRFVEPSDPEKLDFGVVIVKSSTSDNWFHDYIAEASVICFPNRRLRFFDPKKGEYLGQPPWGVAICIFGEPPVSVLEALATGCESDSNALTKDLFDSCLFYEPVDHTGVGQQKTLQELVADGGLSIGEALEASPHWAIKPEGGYSADIDWYLDRSRADAIASPHTETRTRPGQSQ